MAISYLVLLLVLNALWQQNSCAGACCGDFFLECYNTVGDIIVKFLRMNFGAVIVKDRVI